ncbi:MAG: hypothetical protein WBD28_10370 [Candidatus Zixiibacteriota bacterium]
MRSSKKYVGTVFDSETSARIEESFQALWETRTVYFGQERMGGKSLQVGIPFMGAGDRGKDSEFPIQITATLMDSLLIEAGLKYYVSFLEMTPEEEAEFRSNYYSKYDPANNLLIWCELQTNWAKLHLDPDRWTIFIEDDAGNQYEPVQILEESQPIRQTEMDIFPDFQPKLGLRGWESHQKTIMLCFPKFDFYQNPILSDKLQFLKLVFKLSDDQKARAEGIWVFND